MRHVVLGTAGHVDHGKTALIKALTGTDTDRLKEEKERGITIELGFASLKLPSGKTLGIVDVPGHEKFIKHMVSGAAGIDLVMMIIAADESIMPQTKEHLHICSLLGIRSGLVALTKIDMVENDWLELVKTEIQDFLKGTFLEGVPVIPVSALKQKGIDELTAALDTVVQNIPKKNDCGIFRLPVDRVFTMKGFGTVVTGTLISDSISVGEDVLILPEEINTRIRGIQVHNQPTQEATAGQRTAINLQGIEKESLQRGDVLARPGTVVPTTRLDVFIEYLKNNAKSLKNRTLARLHTGASEIIARVILIEKDELAPGEKGFAQLILEKKDVVVTGDRFVLRSYSPITTIGGGLIIDPLPPKHKRLNKKVIEELATLLNGTLPKKLKLYWKEPDLPGLICAILFSVWEQTQKISRKSCSLSSPKNPLLSRIKKKTNIISASFYEKLAQSAAEIISQYQKKIPCVKVFPKKNSRLPWGAIFLPSCFLCFCRTWTANKTIEVDKETVRLFGHKVTLADDLNSIRQEILKIYNEAGLTPSSFKDVINNFQDKKTEAQNIIKLLLKEGSLIKINEELIFTREALDNLRKNYKALLVKEGKATPVSFKELTGLSRKYIIPLMEYFDTDKLTMRVGDHRILREKE